MPRKTRYAAVLLAPLLATACSGSSGGSGGGDRSSPEALTATVYRDLEAGLFGKVCGLFLPEALKCVTDTGVDCQTFLAKHYDPAARARFKDVKVDAGAVRVNGDTAVVPESAVTSGGRPSHDGDTKVAKTGSEWSIAG